MRMVGRSGAEKVKGKYSIVVSVFILWLLVVPVAMPQQTGTVEGRLINGTDVSRTLADVDLEVVALDQGMGIIRTAKTDSTGRFRIEGLPIDSMLMLRAIYKDTNYNRQFRFDATGNASVELEVYEATTSWDAIRVEEYQMVFQAIGDHIQSMGMAVLNNETDPPETFMNSSGNFRFSKPPEIETLPQIRITAPGSSMPVTQSPLESPNGENYYTLYPLKPGKTTIETYQLLPYKDRKYTYIKKFYYATPSFEIGIVPMDMSVSGDGLTHVRNDMDQNIAVYRSDAIGAGTEVKWIFSGGTPLAEQASPPVSSGSQIRTDPDTVSRNAGIIAPLILLGFILVLWYVINHGGGDATNTGASRKKELKKRQRALQNRLGELDRLFETHSIGPKEYQKQREHSRRMLRRISLLLKG